MPLWTNRYNGPVSDMDYARAVAVDGSNNVIVTGWTRQRRQWDYATIQYSSAGVPLGPIATTGQGTALTKPSAVAVDGGNNVIVTGHSVGSGAHFRLRDDPVLEWGVLLWTNRYNGPRNGYDEATRPDGERRQRRGRDRVCGHGTSPIS